MLYFYTVRDIPDLIGTVKVLQMCEAEKWIDLLQLI